MIPLINKTRCPCICIVFILFCFINTSCICLSEGATTLYLYTNDDSYYLGDTFDIIVQFNTTKPVGGWELSLRYDPTILQPTQITPGSYWAEIFDEGTINNAEGTISYIQSWSTERYPDSSHILCNITFKAILQGESEITIDHINVSAPDLDYINVETLDLTITIISYNNASSDGNDHSYHDDETNDTTSNNQNTTNDTNNSDTNLSGGNDDQFNDSLIEDLLIILGQKLERVIDSIDTVIQLPFPLETSYLITYSFDTITDTAIYDLITDIFLPLEWVSDHILNIDADQDGIWEYSYNVQTGTLTALDTPNEHTTGLFFTPLVMLIVLILIASCIFILLYLRKR